MILRCPDGLFAVTVRLGARPVIGEPQFLFDTEGLQYPWNWDMTADGSRFLFLRDAVPAPRRLRVVVGWGQKVDAMMRGAP